jgi:carboxymethylenebutenolidase
MNLIRPEGPHDLTSPTRRALGSGLLGGPVLAGLFTGYAVGAGPAQAAAITTPSDGLETATVTIPSGGFDLPAYLALPDRAARGRRRLPVVIVVSEVFGLHAYIQDVCRRLARAGYVAVAPAFFARAGDPAPLSDWSQIRAIVNTATNAQVMGDIAATQAWLDRQSFAARGARAITGFCWGGAVTWMAAADIAGLRAGVAWYGRLRARPDQSGEQRDWPLDVAGRLRAPVMGLYADQDDGIPLADVEAMRAVLAPGSQIRVYPDTRHGFHADYRPMYAPAAAHDGWARMLSWFARHGVGDGG